MAYASTTSTHAQSAATEWEHSSGGNSTDFAPLVKAAGDGGWIVGGYSYSDVSGTKNSPAYGFGDAWIVKVDAARNLQWERSFGGSEFDRVNDLQPTSDGGYIVGCTSFSDASGNKSSHGFGHADLWVMKLNGSGEKVWEQSFGGIGNDELRAVLQTSDGGFLAAGITYSPASGNKTSGSFGSGVPDYWVVKLDANGNKQWDKSHGGNDADELYAAQQTSDGGFLLGGHSFSGNNGSKSSAGSGSGSSDFWVVKLDASGNAQWDRVYGGPDVEHLYTLQTTRDGGFVMGGCSSSQPSAGKRSAAFGAQDFWAIKADAAGNVQWEKAFGGTGADELHSVQQTVDGGYLLGGISFSGASGNRTSSVNTEAGDYWFVKVDPAGNKQWEQTAPGCLSGDVLRPVATTDNGFVVAGLSTSAVLSHPDFVISKLRAPLHFISQAVIAPGVFHAQLNGTTGYDYVLQASTDLVHWTAVQTKRAADNMVVFTHTIQTGAPLQFFRALPRM